MELTITGIDSTPLDEAAYRAVLQRYGKLQEPVTIVFRDAPTVFGYYEHDRKGHTVCLNAYGNRWATPFDTDNFVSRVQTRKLQRLNKLDWQFKLILTTLHELRHAQQHEKKRSNHNPAKIRNAYTKYIYSEEECDARAYEYTHAHKAWNYYLSKL